VGLYLGVKLAVPIFGFKVDPVFPKKFARAKNRFLPLPIDNDSS